MTLTPMHAMSFVYNLLDYFLWWWMSAGVSVHSFVFLFVIFFVFVLKLHMDTLYFSGLVISLPRYCKAFWDVGCYKSGKCGRKLSYNWMTFNSHWFFISLVVMSFFRQADHLPLRHALKRNYLSILAVTTNKETNWRDIYTFALIKIYVVSPIPNTSCMYWTIVQGWASLRSVTREYLHWPNREVRKT